MSLSDEQRAQREANLRLVRAYVGLVTVMGDALGRLAQKQPWRTSLLRRAMQNVFEEAFDKEWLLVALGRLPRGPDGLAQRLSAVAAFTLVLTRQMLLSPADTVELCMAALVHDLSRVPPELEPPGHLGLRSALRCSADVLTDEVCHQTSVALEWALPLSTNPRATARLIAPPSIFELLTQPGPNRPPVGSDHVMRLLGQLAGQRLDSTAVELFVRTLGFFPPGTSVQLSDGSMAVVVAPPSDANVAQPRVRPLDAKGGLGRELSLSGNPDLMVRQEIRPTVNPLRAWLEP
ncbi:MAG: hypothetical protein JNJ54_16470 [Myxococcaceae bacterium]|nr:hypothetical protein [Myxococcaceae bacterium]